MYDDYFKYDRSFGSAGGGLETNDARAKYGRNAGAGSSGERAFRNLVQKHRLDQKHDVWYGLSIPRDRSNARATRYTSDVDAAISSGTRLVLVDVKRWASGYHYWTLMGKPMKNMMPLRHNDEWRLSANMAAALERYRQHLPGINVSAAVVFVPNTRGAAPASVSMLRWPGGIRSYQASKFLGSISGILKTEERSDPRIQGLLNRLTR